MHRGLEKGNGEFARAGDSILMRQLYARRAMLRLLLPRMMIALAGAAFCQPSGGDEEPFGGGEDAERVIDNSVTSRCTASMVAFEGGTFQC